MYTSKSDSKKRSYTRNYTEFKKKKKRPTYLPKLKLMGRSMANKYIFKDGLEIQRCYSGVLMVCSIKKVV